MYRFSKLNDEFLADRLHQTESTIENSVKQSYSKPLKDRTPTRQTYKRNMPKGLNSRETTQRNISSRQLERTDLVGSLNKEEELKDCDEWDEMADNVYYTIKKLRKLLETKEDDSLDEEDIQLASIIPSHLNI